MNDLFLIHIFYWFVSKTTYESASTPVRLPVYAVGRDIFFLKQVNLIYMVTGVVTIILQFREYLSKSIWLSVLTLGQWRHFCFVVSIIFPTCK